VFWSLKLPRALLPRTDTLSSFFSRRPKHFFNSTYYPSVTEICFHFAVLSLVALRVWFGSRLPPRICTLRLGGVFWANPKTATSTAFYPLRCSDKVVRNRVSPCFPCALLSPGTCKSVIPHPFYSGPKNRFGFLFVK